VSILARYLAAQFFLISSFVLVALLVLFAFFDVIQELGNVGRNNYGLGQAAVVVLLSLPGHMYEILPVAALIGTLLALSRLVTNSEFGVMQVSGLSNWRVAGYFGAIGLVLSAVLLMLGEYVSPWAEQAAQRLKLSATQSVVAQQFRSGLWVRDGAAFINVAEVMPDSTLRGISIYSFDDEGRLESIRAARQGSWSGDQSWQLEEVSETRFGEDGIRAQRIDSASWHSALTPEMLSVLLIAPEKMSARTLWRYVAHLRENGLKAARYELALWSKFVNPLVIPVMMLIAMPFALHGPRARSASGKVFAGILIGLAFHLMSRLFGHLGLLNDWPPFVVSMLPLLSFLAVAYFGLRWVERR
jgi:lipopolysaccharide export system permease protein